MIYIATISSPNCDIQVKVNEEVLLKNAKESVEFFGDWQDLLRENKGCYITTYLKNICRRISNENEDMNTLGVRAYFENAEGYFPLREEYGIELLNAEADSPFIENTDITIKTNIIKD